MAIIGLSGYMSSGKDLTGEIIRYLAANKNGRHNPNIEFNPNNIQYTESGWKIKKFAGKLKQIASLLTGISIEKFEDQEFKKTYLGSEWSSDFVGYLKDEKHKNGFQYEKGKGFQMTVREFLQKLGTEAIRNNIHTNAWVNALFADYVPYYEEGYYGTTPENIKYEEKEIYPKWIITDCRFPNEAQAIKDRGGIVIRVNRPWEPNAGDVIDYKFWSNWSTGTFTHKNGDSYNIVGTDGYKYTTGIIRRHGLHPSETSLDDWKFDYVINNDGSIDDLVEKVNTAIGSYL